MAYQRSILFFVLVVTLGFLQIECRREPYDVCEFKCVQAVFNKYCGGTPCVHGSINDGQRQALCTISCLSAIEGKEMFKCLKAQDPLRGDFKAVQQTLVSQIWGFCVSSETPVVGSEVAHEADDELGYDA